MVGGTLEQWRERESRVGLDSTVVIDRFRFIHSFAFSFLGAVVTYAYYYYM